MEKKILVLSSDGGGGHRSAAEALEQALGTEYRIEHVNALKDVLYPLDMFHRCTGGFFSGEAFYNWMLRKGHHRLVSWYAHLGERYMLFRRAAIARLFEDYLKSQNISLAISVIPFMNAGLAEGASRAGVPFLMVPTDLDVTTFLHGFSHFKKEYPTAVHLALPYKEQEIQVKVAQSRFLQKGQIFTVGFPVRRECLVRYSPQELEDLRKKHGLLEKMKTLSFMMGAQGTEKLREHVAVLATISPKELKGVPLQINIFIGSNAALGNKMCTYLMNRFQGKLLRSSPGLMTIACPQGNFFHIRGFSKDVLEILACCDLCITKTGSCSVNEAIYMRKKLLLDNTEGSSARHLSWEQFNVPFVIRHQLGDAYTTLEELKSKTIQFLQQGEKEAAHFPLPTFHEEMRLLVTQMIQN